MFDELLSQMETALSETKKVKQTLQPFRPEPINYESPLIDCTKTYGMLVITKEKLPALLARKDSNSQKNNNSAPHTSNGPKKPKQSSPNSSASAKKTDLKEKNQNTQKPTSTLISMCSK